MAKRGAQILKVKKYHFSFLLLNAYRTTPHRLDDLSPLHHHNANEALLILQVGVLEMKRDFGHVYESSCDLLLARIVACNELFFYGSAKSIDDFVLPS